MVLITILFAKMTQTASPRTPSCLREQRVRIRLAPQFGEGRQAIVELSGNVGQQLDDLPGPNGVANHALPTCDLLSFGRAAARVCWRQFGAERPFPVWPVPFHGKHIEVQEILPANTRRSTHDHDHSIRRSPKPIIPPNVPWRRTRAVSVENRTSRN